MEFSIVTPAFRSASWLKLCIASVADQEGVRVEHIIQDACSDDGTQDWLPRDNRVRAFVEKDSGMYDAINRGYRRAEGDILGYLNCDEQYLPGALKLVSEFFANHPRVDVLLAASVIVGRDGNYICHRHSLVPHPQHIWFRFPLLSCAVFIRRRVVCERGIVFDARWRDLGDFHWIRALMNQNVPMAAVNNVTSAFFETGENMGLKANALREIDESYGMAPRWVRLLRPLWITHHRLRRLAAGHFFLKPMSYSIYTQKSPAERVTFKVQRPTPIWWSRLT